MGPLIGPVLGDLTWAFRWAPRSSFGPSWGTQAIARRCRPSITAGAGARHGLRDHVRRASRPPSPLCLPIARSRLSSRTSTTSSCAAGCCTCPTSAPPFTTTKASRPGTGSASSYAHRRLRHPARPRLRAARQHARQQGRRPVLLHRLPARRPTSASPSWASPFSASCS